MKKTLLCLVGMILSSAIYANDELQPMSTDDLHPSDCVAQVKTKEGTILASLAEDARIKVNNKVISLKMKKASKKGNSYGNGDSQLNVVFTGKTISKKSDEAEETTTPAKIEFKGKSQAVAVTSICL